MALHNTRLRRSRPHVLTSSRQCGPSLRRGLSAVSATTVQCRKFITRSRDMTIKRMDHVSVVVDDLAAAIAFFTALGMTLEGEAPVEGPWVDRVNGLESVQVDIVMMRTPDGQARL